MTFDGSCHCGAATVRLESRSTPAALGVRTCQCTFCRRHGAVNISDPDGLAIIDADHDDILRYRFGLRTADFLICRRCGVYIAAVIGQGARVFSTLNVVGLNMTAFFEIPEAPMEYGAETTDERIARRYKKWTPTRFSDAALAASNFGPH
ncbi:MAG: aldehyde-activating protein [Pseudomonadota bacterium]